MSKIKDSHLDRYAYVYLRQSIQFQVRNNLESQRQQYGLKKRALNLGFKEVRIIDEDYSTRLNLDCKNFKVPW